MKRRRHAIFELTPDEELPTQLQTVLNATFRPNFRQENLETLFALVPPTVIDKHFLQVHQLHLDSDRKDEAIRSDAIILTAN